MPHGCFLVCKILWLRTFVCRTFIQCTYVRPSIFCCLSIIQNLNGQRKLLVGCSIFHAAASYCRCSRHLLVLGLGKTSVQAIWRPFVRSLVPSYFNEDSRLLSQQDSGPSAHTTLVKEGNRWLRFAAWLKQHWKIQKEKKTFLYLCSSSFIWCFFFPSL